MSMRPKTRRRLVISSLCFLLVCAIGAGAYGVRKSRLNARLIASRAEGMEAFKAGDYETALHKVGAYLQKHPEDVDTLYVYSQCRIEVEDPDGKYVKQAIAGFRQLLSYQPNHDGARHKLLDIYVRSGLNSEAIDAADKLLDRDKNDLSALRARTISLLRTRRFDEALTVAEAHHKLAPLDIEVQGWTLQLMGFKGRPIADIVSYATQLQARHPNAPEAELLLSVAHAMANQRDEAVRWARAAAGRNKRDADFAILLASQLDALELFDESQAALQTVSEGGDLRIRRELTMRLLQHGDYDKVASRLADVDPTGKRSDPELLAIRAIALATSGHRDQAIPIIEGLEHRSDVAAKAWAPILRAGFGSETVDDKAVLTASEAGLGRAENPYIWLLRGDAFAHLGENDMAIKSWWEARKRSGAWNVPLKRLTATLGALGRYEEAIYAGRAARTRAPKDRETLISLLTSVEGRLGQLKTIAAAQGAKGAAIQPALTTALSATATELAELIGAAAAAGVREDDLIPDRVALASGKDGPDAAKKIIADTIGREKPLSETAYIRLALQSHELKLRLSDQALAASQRHNGISPNLAFTQAILLQLGGKAPEGMKLFDAARSDPKRKGEAAQWDLQWTRYLEAAKDARATEHWVRLADASPADIALQWGALGAPSTQSDRDFRSRVIGRLQDRIGGAGTSWKIAKVRLLMTTDKPAEKDVVDAAGLLGEVVRSAPNLVAPRLMLANCLERLGNVSGAIEQLTIASDASRGSSAVELDLARLFTARGDADQAVAHLDRLAAIKAATPDERRRAASLLLRQGNATRALEILKANGADDATPVEPSVILASAYLQTGDIANAQKTCDALMKGGAPNEATIEFAANLYAASGRTADAEAALAQLDEISKTPGLKETIRGIFAARHGDPKRATESLEDAVKLVPANASAWEWLMRTQMAGGNVEPAIATAQRAASSIEKSDLRQKGFSTIVENTEAIKRIAAEPSGRALATDLLDPSDRDPCLEVIKLSAGAQANPAGADRKQLLLRLRTIAEQNPKVYGVQIYATNRLLQSGQLDDGIRLASRAVQTFPNESLPTEMAARALAAAGRWSEAVGAAEKWRARSILRPREADLILATALIGAGRPKDAIELLKPYLVEKPASNAPTPDEDRPRVIYARALVAAGDQEQVSQKFVGMLHRSAEWRALWIRTAGTKLTDYTAAAIWLDQAAANIPPGALDEQVLLGWGWQSLANGSKNPAHQDRATQLRTECNEHMASAKEKKDGQVVMSLAMLNELADDLPRSEACYRKVLALNPDDILAKNNLAMILAKQPDRIQEGLALASAAAAIEHPNQPNFRETLATILEKQKKYDDAITSMTLAVRAQPSNKAWQIHLADILYDSGDARKAKETLKLAESLEPKESDLARDTRDRLAGLRAKLAKGNSSTNTDTAVHAAARVLTTP